MIAARTIGHAHEQVIRNILLDGFEVTTEDGEETLELPLPLHLHITYPSEEPKVSDCCLFKPGFMEEYTQKVLGITPARDDGKDFSYTYGNRLNHHPSLPKGVNQIKEICRKLIINPQTRRAILHTWSPGIDLFMKDCPCLQTIQFLIRDNLLNMILTFRSQDALSALGANLYALQRLQETVAEGVSVKSGSIDLFVASSHIYHKRDALELMRFRKKLNV